MAISHTLKLLLSHPLTRPNKIGAFSGFLKWQISSRLNPHPVIYPFTEKCNLIVKRGMTGATGNIYCGLHEFEDMGFLLHFLRPGDLFIDAGANIGSYTILASGHAGAHAIAVEPIPSTFDALAANIRVNDLSSKVAALNLGLGSKKGKLRFTRSFDTVNHVATTTEEDTVEVEIQTLDEICKERKPQLLKIDVEGFETEVLAGGMETLNAADLKAIIIELNGSGGRYGFDEANIHNHLLSIGFKAFRYQPFERSFFELSTFGAHNTLYLRDFPFVQERVQKAEKVRIKKQEF